MRPRSGLVLLAALLCTLAPGPSQAAGDARHEAGRRIYNFRCYYCHGYSGDARTLAASYVKPKPRDFTHTSPAKLSRKKMLKVVANGERDSAMAGFKGILKQQEMELVVDFVRKEFMHDKARNTHYHTVENGWPDHGRYRAAYPFATGKIALDTPLESLTLEQGRGKQLYLSSCVCCHDRGRVQDEGVIWDARPVSFPRIGYSHVNPPKVDALTSATPYSRHDIVPKLGNLSPREAHGRELWQVNCAFCHGADGTGKNWIGTFMEPHARDLTGEAMTGMTRSRLKQAISDGLPNTSMPAWKSVLGAADIEALIDYISRAFHPVLSDPPNRKG